MKTGFASVLASLALLLALAPSPARAQAPIDCSSGCYIVTCNTQLCSLWRCDAKGCEWITGWDRQLAEGPLSIGQAANSPAKTPAVAHVSVCPPGERCDLYEITATEALRLGSFDNMSDLVQHRRLLRGEPARQK